MKLRIYTKAGDLAFEEFTFPDGQPHFKLLTHDNSFRVATIEIAFKSPLDVFRAQMAANVLSYMGYQVNLDIRYLLAARMDRRIDSYQPYTLDIVMSLLNRVFKEIRILDVHNPMSVGAGNVLPFDVVKMVMQTLGDVLVVIPDKGATERVRKLTAGLTDDLVQCEKHRDSQTGRITKLTVEGGTRVAGKECLIIDDICDGGATFITLGNALKDAGASKVHLFVTHGIFSKGFASLVNNEELYGKFKGPIDRIFCTDSYRDWHVTPFVPVSCIPVSMKEMR